ncbi:uncharacterized protein RAG0_07713 [Rhynchosporium agropyri]|uniref:Kinetochore protein fta7 n=1 Tax=Rhynchosporium agropyri TaxID=914238 RepID=A0A1E1KMZ1_9HELO|nr:uncharacterized protein RAG0_07713 [Rhynchosporium agropyri]
MDNLMNARSQAPEPALLKRQRSRPSDWWAAKPTNASHLPTPARAPVVRKVEMQHVGMGGAQSQAQAPEPEVRSLKRQRSRPSEWWAASPSKAPGPSAPAPVSARAPDVWKEAGERVGGVAAGGKKKNKESQSHSQVKESGVSILKRRRSKPSEWWATNTLNTSPGPASAIVVNSDIVGGELGEKKRTGKSGGGIHEVIGAGNRGRVAQARSENEEVASKSGRGKGKANIVPENGNNTTENRRFLRRLRSSAGETDLRIPGGSSDESAEGVIERTGKKRGGQAMMNAQEDNLGNKALERGRPSVVRAEEQADELLPGQMAAPERRDRPFTDGVDMAGQKESERTEVTTRQNRQYTAHHEDQGNELVSGASEIARSQSRRGRLSPASTEKDPEEKLAKCSEKLGQKSVPGLGQAGRTRTQDIPASTRTQQRETAPEEQIQSQAEEQERGRSRTRQSDIQVDEVIRDRGWKKSQRSDDKSQQVAQRPMVARDSNTTKSGRRSEVVEVETASSKLTKNRDRKRAKPSSENVAPVANKGSLNHTSSKTKNTTQPSNTTSSAISQTQKKASKRPSQIKATQRKRKEDENAQLVPSKRQRVEQIRGQGNVEEIAVNSLDYQHLQAVQKMVSRRTVETKWEALPPSGVDRISQLLTDLQHPVIARLKDERKKTQVRTALEAWSRKLIKKLSQGLPFPPGTRNHREDDFDFEKILDHNRALEAQLTPTLHSNQLLEAELSKERARLDSDLEILAELEKNAKAEAAMRNKAARRLHSVLRPVSSSAEVDLLKDKIGLMEEQIIPSFTLGSQDDNSLHALVRDLDGHVDTIKGNIKQVQGVSQAIVKSRAAVQATLFEHLDSLQYDDVVLGAD